jgi:hypothetical protein
VALVTEFRSLTQVAADLKADSARLAGALYTSGLPNINVDPLHEFGSRMDTTADLISASGIGNARAAGQAHAAPQNLVELTTHMAGDLAKLTVGLRDAGLDPVAVDRLAADAQASSRDAIRADGRLHARAGRS